MPTETAPNPAETSTSDYSDSYSFQVEAQGHAFTFYPRGSDRLAALLDHIKEAEESLDLFYYMFQDDGAGTKVRDALLDAVVRGVRVYLIVDDFGSDAPPEFFEPLVEAGGKFAVFSPRFGLRYLIRNHQKFAIADGARVMTGGSNVSDHYFAPPEENGWCDLGVAIEGPVVARFSEWFALIGEWIESGGSQLRKMRRILREWDPGNDSVQLTLGGPVVRAPKWAYKLKRDLAKAHRLDLVTAYFTPQRSIQRQIARVARRGKVRMITAGKSDISASIDAARLLYKRALRAGAQIHEFQPCKLHMKLLIVDAISYFGSANMDRRSLRINLELMVRVEDEALAARLREFVDHLQDASLPITSEWYRENAGLWQRLRWRASLWLGVTDAWLARRLNP